MKTIPLSLQGKNKVLNLSAIVDDEDFEELSKYRWHVYKHRNTFYVRRMDRKSGKSIIIQMHRFLLKQTDPAILVDHIDRNGLNNQKNNLRTCTTSQNCANQKSAKNSSSQYLGVSWITKLSKWQAKASKNRKSYFIGYFENEKDAALAYNHKAIELHGEFANLNQA